MTKLLTYSLVTSCLIGLALSIYSYAVERAIEHDKNYVASCDLSESMSCKKAFTSKYGKGFGLFGDMLGPQSMFNQPNSFYGILFYSFLATICLTETDWLITVALFSTLHSIVASFYFAYILMFVLHNLCIVCVSIYVVNFVNLVLIVNKLKYIRTKKLKLKLL